MLPSYQLQVIWNWRKFLDLLHVHIIVSGVLETHTKEVQISLTLLHPHSPSRSYPDVPVIVTLPLTEILIKVCPRSRTGHVYTLTQRLKLQRKLEHIRFLSLLHVSFCQCVLYYVCVNVLQRTCLNNYFNIS